MCKKVNAYIQAYDAEATDKLAGELGGQGKKKKRTQPLHERASIQDFLWIEARFRAGQITITWHWMTTGR